ncbi:hypothetical protein H9M94_01220 [Mycoplasma sp. Pen4]|uniref:hypothetical protein n=1 Tax=Mycoplasma sp. Pen4 TaxID=640330 RepID=UPI0016543041|nr:hypothetical protein [Mycoplasma sp. Pen4]QNM93878.1 hypothetical protein H9M94_01220 [Mycoplasma sp. Pen4]
MSLITLRKNYFQNNAEKEKESNKANEIIEQIKSLNFKGSSFLGFDDIAINFTLNGVDQILSFVDKLYKRNIDILIIWTKKEIQIGIEAALEFIFGKYDYNQDKKIQLVFINEQQTPEYIDKEITYQLNKNQDKNISLLFLDSFGNNESQKYSIETFISKFNHQASEFLIQKSIYYIGSRKTYTSITNVNVPYENIFFVSDDIHSEYSLVSELSMILLATQGVNIQNMIDGYANMSQKILNPDIYFNVALDLAMVFNANLSKKEHHGVNNIFIAYDVFAKKLAKLFSYMFNKTTLELGVLNSALDFPTQISTYGQTLLTSDDSIFVNFITIKEKLFDYQTSSNLENDDLIDQLKPLTINQFNAESFTTFNNYLTSYNSDLKSIQIEIQNNSEQALGELISLLYWSRIFYCVLNDLDSFKIN